MEMLAVLGGLALVFFAFCMAIRQGDKVSGRTETRDAEGLTFWGIIIGASLLIILLINLLN